MTVTTKSAESCLCLPFLHKMWWGELRGKNVAEAEETTKTTACSFYS